MTAITAARLAKLVAKNRSWAGVMRSIPIRPSPDNRKALIDAADALGLDHSHFDHGRAWAGGLNVSDPRLAKRRRTGLTIKGA